VVEDKLPESVHNRPAQVRLDNDRLCLDPLQNWRLRLRRGLHLV